MKVEFEINKKFIALIPSLNINLHSNDIEFEWIIFGIYLTWK